MNWEIDYKFCFAKCEQMTVVLREVEKPTKQELKGIKTSFGFTKIESNKMYQGYIISISDELLGRAKEDTHLLAQYASSLGDQFNEYLWEEERIADMKILLGKFPKQQELADFLGVNKATVSGYSDKKKKLWLNGLWVLNKTDKKVKNDSKNI